MSEITIFNGDGEKITYIRRGRGTVLLTNGYQYYKNKTFVNGSSHWKCSKYKRLKCLGSVTLKDDAIIRCKAHDERCSPNVARNDVDFALHELLMVKGRNGKDLLMLNGYTYYQHKHLRDGFRWSCTQMGSRSCRGFLHVTNNMLVIRAHTEHTHPPSIYFLESTKTQKSDDTKKSNEAINPLALNITNIHGRSGLQ